MKKIIAYLLFVVFVIIVDQVSKIYVFENFRLGESVPVIDGFFNLTYVQNKGAAFGFGGTFNNWIRYTLFLFVPVIACFWLLYALVKSIKGPAIMSWAYALILGGAVGNLIDRFRLDFVVDFFDFYIGTSHFATFNVADAAISLAAGLIILDYFLNHKKNENASGTGKA